MDADFFRCECCTHLLEVECNRLDDWPFVEISLWTRGNGHWPMPWRERLRLLWSVARGKAIGDHVVLKPEEARRLGERLHAVARS